ncbi:laccase-14-like isoform X2 [Syzygium oleosum]|uniref:laccase-14-like isoform X2 n=1 Tax=Syzygium oleosum TaxID=219896 RepID=UPI0024BB1B7E|nr:laccase-14-like isoform X2 [Syzygium oleosum]
MGRFLGLGFTLTLLFCMAQGKVLNYDFVVKETPINMLCETNRSVLTVNGLFPGPEIRAHKGDTIYVNVTNMGPYGVTIHWHGVRQIRYPWSDGPEYVTQCPIPTNSSFLQKIILTDEEGTLWWHAHSDWSRATIHGPIIILPINNTKYPYEFDKQHTIVISEWYARDVMDIITEALESGGDPDLSVAYTINGQPGDSYTCSNDSTYNITVVQGKTFLLRIIHSGLNEEMFFGIAEHNITVVGMDGAYLKPLNTDYLIITPGQTMDVLVTANQTPDRYYMVFSPFVDTNAPSNENVTRGIFEYNGTYNHSETPVLPMLPGFTNKSDAGNFTIQLRSLNSIEHPSTVPTNVTRNITITVSVNQQPCPANKTCTGPDGSMHSASLNNISFWAPSISILQAYYNNISGVYNKTFPDKPPFVFDYTGDVSALGEAANVSTEVLMINYNEEVEIRFQGTNFGLAENHPMHLHGYSFYVVGMGDGNFSDSYVSDYNTVDPPYINTVGLPKNGWTAIRFKADNPGVWFMHCHLERHASWGMDTVLVVKDGTNDDQKVLPPPKDMPPCSGS